MQENKSRYCSAQFQQLKKVLVHLGPHKTGTTSFQVFLKKNEIILNEAGISAISVQSSNAQKYKAWRIK